ncbi:MAG: amidase [Myxococcota bacterium]
MSMSDLESIPFFSASRLVELMRTGELTSSTVVDAMLHRLDRVNPRIRAVVALDAALARSQARASDEERAQGTVRGPLHGLPFTAKDTFATRDFPTTIGLPLYGARAPRNAAAVQALLDAGGILLGKTNVPFAAYDWQSNHPRFGRTHNPYDQNRTAGGSSGGAAAALAASLSPLELGSDVAGSIRVPCHFCGVWGLRPTDGVVPIEGHAEVPFSSHRVRHMVRAGPMTRTGADLSLAFSVFSPTERTPSLPSPTTIRLRASFGVEPFAPTPTVRATLTAFEERLSAAGVTLLRDPPSFDPEALTRLWGFIQGCDMSATLPALARLPGFSWLNALAFFRGRLGHGIVTTALRRGAQSSSKDLEGWLSEAEEEAKALEANLEGTDGWLLPVAPFPAFLHQRTGSPIHVEGRRFPYADAHAYYNCPVAVLGLPAVAFPAGVTTDNLPVGVQLVGRRGGDMRLVQVARTLAEAAGTEGRLVADDD